MPISRGGSSIDLDYAESDSAEQLYNEFAGPDFAQVPLSSSSRESEDKALQQKHILPNVDIAQSGNWFIKNVDKFDIAEGAFKTGDLSLKEIELALGSKTEAVTLDERAHLRFYKKNFEYFTSLNAEYVPASVQSITKGDMHAFNKQLTEYADELSTLKRYEPGRYEAVSSLRKNFRWLDHNKDGSVSYEEVNAGINLPNLPEVDKRGLKAVASYFPIITESPSGAGYDRPIGAETITSFIFKSNLPYQEVYSGRYSPRQPKIDTYKRERLTKLEALLQAP